MNIGLASAQFINNDVDNNIKTLLKYMRTAKERNTDLLLFGECFLQGFDALCWDPINDINIGIEKNSGTIMTLREHCKKLRMAAGIGYIEKDDNKLYSSYLIIDNNGNDLTNYKRISKGWRIKGSDGNFYREGTEFKIFEYMGRKITVGLCGDFWTDEVIKMTPKAIDMIIWPVFVDFAVDLWEKSEFIEYVKKAKSVSKNVFFVNSICKEEKSLSHGGAFALIDNTLKYKLNMDEEGILYCMY